MTRLRRPRKATTKPAAAPTGIDDPTIEVRVARSSVASDVAEVAKQRMSDPRASAAMNLRGPKVDIDVDDPTMPIPG